MKEQGISTWRELPVMYTQLAVTSVRGAATLMTYECSTQGLLSAHWLHTRLILAGDTTPLAR